MLAWKTLLDYTHLFSPSEFYIRRNNNKVDSVEIGHIFISDLFPWSDLEKCIYIMPFYINDDKTLSSLLNL